LTAAGPDPLVDLRGLARLFVTPVLFGEFAPSSFWCGVDLDWPRPPAYPDDRIPLVDRFADTVARLCSDADTVAVSVSGGLDSLAVLWHVLQLNPTRRVLAYTVDLVDDADGSAAELVVRILRNLDLTRRVELAVVSPRDCQAQPAWSPHGPRMDALPHVNASIANLAADAGAGVLLSGNGADELMAVPRYAAVDVCSAVGPRAALRYLADMATAAYGVAGELAAIAARLIPARQRARAYVAATWPDWCRPTASPVVQSRWHDDSLAWARAWVDTVLDAHAAAGRTWAQCDAVDAWWPRAYLPAAGPIPEASPFCDENFVGAARSLPLGRRYNPSADSTYHRVKGGVTDLFPSRIRPALPRTKRYYATALQKAFTDDIRAPIAAEIGLIDPSALAMTTDTATRMMAAAVETWLAGAVNAGVRL
jgi:Asparagine synthase